MTAMKDAPELVRAGTNSVIVGVAGIAIVLDYEPMTIQDTPLVYTTIGRGRDATQGQVRGHVYRFRHRLVLSTQDMESAEDARIQYLGLIVQAFANDPKLGNTLVRGYSRIVEWRPVIMGIAGSQYSCLDIYSETVIKGLTT